MRSFFCLCILLFITTTVFSQVKGFEKTREKIASSDFPKALKELLKFCEKNRSSWSASTEDEQNKQEELFKMVLDLTDWDRKDLLLKTPILDRFGAQSLTFKPAQKIQAFEITFYSHRANQRASAATHQEQWDRLIEAEKQLGTSTESLFVKMARSGRFHKAMEEGFIMKSRFLRRQIELLPSLTDEARSQCWQSIVKMIEASRVLISENDTIARTEPRNARSSFEDFWDYIHFSAMEINEDLASFVFISKKTLNTLNQEIAKENQPIVENIKELTETFLGE